MDCRISLVPEFTIMARGQSLESMKVHERIRITAREGITVVTTVDEDAICLFLGLRIPFLTDHVHNLRRL